jgi:hypothetical protein
MISKKSAFKFIDFFGDNSLKIIANFRTKPYIGDFNKELFDYVEKLFNSIYL